MRSSDLNCSLCGYKRKLNFALSGVGDEAIPEPPVAEWREELSTKKTFSEESLKEVKKEFAEREKGQNKKPDPATNLQSQYDEPRRSTRDAWSKHRPRSRRSPMSYLFALVSIASIIYAIYQYSGISVNGYKTEKGLKVGECIREMDSTGENSDGSVGSVKSVKCSEIHKWEVFYTGTITGDLNSDAERSEYVGNQCDVEKATYLTQLTGASAFNFKKAGIQYIYPSDGSWPEGDRLFTCLAGDDKITYTQSFLD
jgi:hypothetical protein